MIKESEVKELTKESEEIENNIKVINTDFYFENKYGLIQNTSLYLKLEKGKRHIELEELAFVRIQANQDYGLNWIGLFFTIVFFTFFFIADKQNFYLVSLNFILFLSAMVFSMFYKKNRYLILIVLRVAQLVAIRVDEKELTTAKEFVSKLSSQIR